MKSLIILFNVITGSVYEQIFAGVSCLVVSPAERERGGSSKVAEAVWVSSLLPNKCSFKGCLVLKILILMYNG